MNIFYIWICCEFCAPYDIFVNGWRICAWNTKNSNNMHENMFSQIDNVVEKRKRTNKHQHDRTDDRKRSLNGWWAYIYNYLYIDACTSARYMLHMFAYQQLCSLLVCQTHAATTCYECISVYLRLFPSRTNLNFNNNNKIIIYVNQFDFVWNMLCCECVCVGIFIQLRVIGLT